MVSRIAVELAFCEQVIALYMIDSEKSILPKLIQKCLKGKHFNTILLKDVNFHAMQMIIEKILQSDRPKI